MNTLDTKINNWFNRNWNHYQREVATNIAHSEMSEYSNDLCVQCFEEFMKKKTEQKQQMLDDDKILNFLLYCASFQIRSGTSPFYHRYRKHRANNIPDYFAENEQDAYELDDIEIDTFYQCMKEAMTEENIGWYYCKLLELKYIQQMTFKEIIDFYGVSEVTLKRDVSKALQAVRDYCKHLNN